MAMLKRHIHVKNVVIHQYLKIPSYNVLELLLCIKQPLSLFARNKKSDSERELNQKQAQLLGKTVRLEKDVQRGNCRIRLGDSLWSARCDEDIPAGTMVVVTDVNGIVLTIAPEPNR
ncbi:NfeD family protein [Vibrio sp. SCSIO 43137]|uniref:NfeD family protein n=1 Tax=Vibrio sp. SCSIO 43137 TaxID=3021011 RepID=UPI0023075E79|nr:NfeD family protein [Vibrio sp. SCSIO 43137]WCE31213.1 NfeD family protein [Vibrio sp. SCSIO 43137]